ncbi:RloB family protein [Flavobacterium sp.]|uniref:RloB family protein n=1 Tax=Flavobacterium sp. TaxID=239 RepID=UPI0035B143E0
MNRKKYSASDYNKAEAFQDATKFFIIYEGTVKEPNYFQAFNESFLNRKSAYVHHILEANTGIIGNTPLKLKERAELFIKNPPTDINITPSKEDKFRFILDVDKHPKIQIEELKTYCDSLFDANLYISNYCFEVWLWAHFKNFEDITSVKSSEMKTELGTLNLNHFPFCFMNINLINDAINKSEKADTDKNNYFPAAKSTKVYLLIKELLEHSILNEEVKNPEII